MQNKIIKMVTRGSNINNFSLYKFQSPHDQGIWKNCTFTFNPLIEKYDWLVILDNIPNILTNTTELLKCPKENTILVTTEPSSISRYGKHYAQQFHYLITSQNESVLPHPNAFRSQTGIYWLYGKNFDAIVKDSFLPKTKKLSTICSDKRDGHTLHQQRFDFTRIIEKAIPELDRFGRGFRYIENKYEALDAYEFHVVIENHIEKHMWSEKLADAFLGFTIPIYYGCPNIFDYFPKDSLIQIDINNIEESITTIKNIINTPGEYEKRLSAVQEARKRVIYEYNLLAMICNVVNHEPTHEFTPEIKIYSRRKMRSKNLDDLLQYFNFRIHNFLRNIINKLFH